MTRKDYQLIAKALRACRPDAYSEEPARVQFVECCASLSSALAADSPAFKRDLFLNACGINGAA